MTYLGQKHTPGDWLQQSDVSQGDGARFEIVSYDRFHGVHICSVGPSPRTGPIKSVPDSERFANAKLIAAAPDLFDALEEMMIGHAQFEDDGSPCDCGPCTRARAAIARVRGA